MKQDQDNTNRNKFKELMKTLDKQEYPELEGTMNLCNDIINEREARNNKIVYMNNPQDQMKDLLRRMDEMSNQLSSINEKATALLDALVNKTKREQEPKQEPKKGFRFYLARLKKQ